MGLWHAWPAWLIACASSSPQIDDSDLSLERAEAVKYQVLPSDFRVTLDVDMRRKRERDCCQTILKAQQEVGDETEMREMRKRGISTTEYRVVSRV